MFSISLLFHHFSVVLYFRNHDHDRDRVVVEGVEKFVGEIVGAVAVVVVDDAVVVDDVEELTSLNIQAEDIDNAVVGDEVGVGNEEEEEESTHARKLL